MFGLSVKALIQRAKNFRTKIFRGGPNFSEKIGPGDQNFQDKNSSDRHISTKKPVCLFRKCVKLV